MRTNMLSVAVALSLGIAAGIPAQSGVTSHRMNARSATAQSIDSRSAVVSPSVENELRRIAPDSTSREWRHATRNGALAGLGIGVIASFIAADRLGADTCSMESTRPCGGSGGTIMFVGVGTAITTAIGALIGGTVGLIHNELVAR